MPSDHKLNSNDRNQGLKSVTYSGLKLLKKLAKCAVSLTLWHKMRKMQIYKDDF